MKLSNRVFYFLLLSFLNLNLFAEQQVYTFGVLAQKSAVITANTWNPILCYIEKKTGIKLILKTTRTGTESKKAIDNGEYDFVYSNQLFDSKKLIYAPILKPNTPDISGQIVVLENSTIKSLEELNGQTVGFPSKAAFVAYAITKEYLRASDIEFNEVFGGNQEGIMAQLKAGNIKAASVNNEIMKAYSIKEKLNYRVLWESKKYADIPIAANKNIPKADIIKIQDAVISLSKDSDGIQILKEISKITKQDFSQGFSKATIHTYQEYINFYKSQK